MKRTFVPYRIIQRSDVELLGNDYDSRLARRFFAREEKCQIVTLVSRLDNGPNSRYVPAPGELIYVKATGGAFATKKNKPFYRWGKPAREIRGY